MSNWAKIVADHGGVVWQTAWRLLGNGADAADCYQETFLAALELSRRQPIRNWPGLLVRLATCKALDQLRRRSRQACDGPGQLAAVACSRPGPAVQVGDAELAAALRSALAELPSDQAEAFALRHFGQMSYRDIARAMGMKTSAVGVLLHRGRARLKELLSPYSPHEAGAAADDVDVEVSA